MPSGGDLEKVLVGERELWSDCPPHELFRRLRREGPVRWSERIAECLKEPGFWSLTGANDMRKVSRDWASYSSERGGVTAVSALFAPELWRAMSPAWICPSTIASRRFSGRGFTPRRIAAYQGEIRAIGTDVLDRLARRESCDLDAAQPVIARVMGSLALPVGLIEATSREESATARGPKGEESISPEAPAPPQEHRCHAG